MIEGEGDAFVTDLGKNRESVFQAMVGEAVGVVAEEHGSVRLRDRLEILDLRDALPQFLLQSHDEPGSV